MRRTSLVYAKAHLSELVDEAQHHKRPVLILRHGKPAAVIVSVDFVPGAPSLQMTPENARNLLDRLVAHAPQSTMTLSQALGRDRLDSIAR